MNFPPIEVSSDIFDVGGMLEDSTTYTVMNVGANTLAFTLARDAEEAAGLSWFVCLERHYFVLNTRAPYRLLVRARSGSTVIAISEGSKARPKDEYAPISSSRRIEF